MQVCEEKSVKTSVPHTTNHQPAKNDCFMVDEHGKEIPITTSMVQDVCIELLRLCRTVKS
ncbi:PA1571 family protein [Acinetobacter sp.]|uniref:PA1571 family protein n=1 Tax=Acinetobacter sp. TaxID=472 RepID=UPI0031D056B1